MLEILKMNWHFWMYRNHSLSYVSHNLKVCECGKQWVQ